MPQLPQLGPNGCSEMVGKHISILAPGFEAEQRALLDQIGSGKEVARYHDARRRKDGNPCAGLL
jgi:hypothetical protein